jgi:hypothetical protein
MRSRLATFTTVVFLSLVSPAVANADPPASFPLHNSFSMAIALPGAGPHEPTSCIDANDEGGELRLPDRGRCRGDRR